MIVHDECMLSHPSVGCVTQAMDAFMNLVSVLLQLLHFMSRPAWSRLSPTFKRRSKSSLKATSANWLRCTSFSHVCGVLALQ